jgi:8-oxo-dGTP pyrophosphatase MutT (NUDIX family)
VPSLTVDGVRRALAGAPASRLAERLPRRSAVALILRPAGPELEALFIRRSERSGDPWSGQMAFPGGRAEPGEPLLDTAVRETAEEVGLDLARGAELLGALDELQAIGRGRAMGLSIQPFVFALGAGDRAPELRLSGEVASAHWLPLPALFDPGHRAPLAYEHEGVVLQLPSLQVDGVVIWGLTYRMLEAFGEMVGAR